ncbi:hypothetical protein ACFL0H_05620 [Thermodesulfobacteriota bacterium]
MGESAQDARIPRKRQRDLRQSSSVCFLSFRVILNRRMLNREYPILKFFLIFEIPLFHVHYSIFSFESLQLESLPAGSVAGVAPDPLVVDPVDVYGES